MTRQPKSMVPKVRFKGFTDEWEHRELGEVSEKITQKNKDNLYSVTLTNSAEYGIIDQRSFFDKDISNAKNLSNYYVVHPDDFVYNPRISNEAPVGPIKRNNLDITGVMSPLYYVFRPHDINKTFLEYYFSTSKWHKFMKLNGNSGARSDRFSIKDSEFVKMPIPSPKNEEQVKIGKLLSTVATYLALQQRKLDQLNTLKKGLLQKMFADKKHPQPELRFKGFSGDWEQQKLKTVVNRVTRKNVNNESNLPLTISAQDGLIAQDHFFGKKVASQNLQNYLLLKKGDFAYNKSYSNGYPFGSIKRLNKYKEGVISSLYIAFKPKQADSDYLEQFFDSDKWHREIYSRAAEGARNHGLLNISPNDFFDADVKLPSSNEEQKMIGDILKKVSEIITLQQKQIDKLNSLKKSLLQNMFI